jgi:hypothetical protein
MVSTPKTSMPSHQPASDDAATVFTRTTREFETFAGAAKIGWPGLGLN